MPFVKFETEAFGKNLSQDKVRPKELFVYPPEGRLARLDAQFDSPIVRRPTRGLEIKERSPAHLTILKRDGEPVLLNNSVGHLSAKDAERHSAGGSGFRSAVSQSNQFKDKYWTDFMLLQVRESRAEKFQISETFGDDFVFFFGEKPRLIEVTGVLLNSRDFAWRAQFWKNWDEHLRGTKLVESGARAYLSYDDLLVEGYMLRADAVDRSDDPFAIPFNFSMLQTGYVDLRALSFDAMRQWREETDVDGETVGSLLSEVTSNGRPVHQEPGFADSMLSLMAGLAIGLTTVAVAGILKQQGLSTNSKIPFVDHHLQKHSSRVPLHEASGYVPGPAPLKSMLSAGTAATPSSGQIASGNTKAFESVAGGANARRVFGTGLHKTHSMVKLPSM